MICEEKNMVGNFAFPSLIKYFEELSAIPRASYNEDGVAEYLCNFAKARGLEYYRDAANNVLINAPATKGREGDAAILLQGHTDMVCEKNAGVEHDFSRDGLKLYVKDGWLRAEGTTLGADDGIAVASMLCILDGGVESHGPLQCLFTASEEVGLDGVKAFDYDKIYARRMINMDSADESLIIAGCTGGQRSSVSFESKVEKTFAPFVAQINITGLFGGHSGEDIDKGRANANKLMGRVLYELMKNSSLGLDIISVEGGTKDNAIPRECVAVVAVNDAESLKKGIAKLEATLGEGLSEDDKDFAIGVSVISENTEVEALEAELAKKIVFVMHTVANGVLDMNHNVKGIVEWSRNLGIVKCDADVAELVFSSRSSFESRIDAAAAELDSYAELIGASVRHYNRYPGWSYAEKSEIRDAYSKAYKELFGKAPEITVIHAGLECGFISEAVQGMDIISCGPVILNLHSPDEALNLASFERFFSVVKKVIEG